MIFGDGGHAKVVRDVMRATESWWPLDWILGKLYFVAIGNNRDRKRVVCEQSGPALPALVHPSAYVAPSAKLGVGTIVMAGAIVQPFAYIGKHCIINTGATVDHDCMVDDYAHIAPGAHLCGGVHVGEGALVGVGVGIAPLAKIPAWSLVKARRLEIEPLPTD